MCNISITLYQHHISFACEHTSDNGINVYNEHETGGIIHMQETNDFLTADYERKYFKKEASAGSLIFTEGRKTISLNGEWNYTLDQYDTCLRQNWENEVYHDNEGRTLPVDFSFDTWDKVTLPCSMNMFRPEYFWYEGPFVFTRKFSIDASVVTKGRVFLRIGAANYVCRVFLNKEYIGQHRGGSTPFMFDITDYLKDENRIILVSDNTRKHNNVPTENTDWFNYSGVYRDIEIIEVPDRYIKDFRISLVPGSDCSKIEASFKTSENDGSVIIRIPELDLEKTVEISGGKGSIVMDAPDNLKLWSPETPALYKVTAEYYEDSISDTVGFREISVQGNDIYLNGSKIFLRGISVHEDSYYTGKALTDEEREEIVNTAADLGANYLRLAHYPHNEAMAKLCDRRGILLWEEIPVYWSIAFKDPDTYAVAENQLEELICRDYNRASVIIWSVGNENPDTDERYGFMSGLADHAHSSDTTRMVSAACLVDGATLSIRDRLAEKLDIIGLNEYIGWYSPNFAELPALFENSHPYKPVVITEFGADAMAGLHGSIDDKGTEECQAEVYRKQIETIRAIPYIKGMTPWILFDFRCPRRTSSIQLFFNRKGLVTSDRKYRKPAFDVLREFYESFS